jgi:serine/threonine protein kinase
MVIHFARTCQGATIPTGQRVASTQQFGKYVLQRRLAEGGMAEVFLAKQTGMEGFEKLVVVKRILPQLCSDDSFVKMFLNEARVAARLNHPNVVQIFDLGKLGEQYFIAMEYVHGEDLRTLIKTADERKRRPNHGLACRVLADTLAGLHYAHTRVGADGKPLGLVHRDVSPQNVLVTYEGSVKLVDFGIAKATREVGAAQTQAGLLKGKYAYMAPEQARGQKLDARSDVFCIGVLLWELTTWQRLFKRPTEMATLMAVAHEPIRSPKTVDATIPNELEWLIMKALARNPDERFGSAQDMRAALESLIRANGWEADSLALANWMHDLFSDKLKAQQADVAASGLGTLEDFLLTVEENTSISWIAPPDTSVKTPSTGLPSSRPVSGPQAPASYDDGPTTQQDPLYPEGANVPTLPGTTPAAAANGPVATVPLRELPKLSKVSATEPTLPAMSGEIVPSRAPLIASPTAATMGVVAPATPVGSETPSMNLGPQANPLFPSADRSTAKRAAYQGEPSRWRRIAVAGSAAALVAAVALTVVFWPTAAPTTTPPLTTTTTTTTTTSPETLATLKIVVDAPATIAVDGKPEPPGVAATVNVQPGVEHVVTVQRPGHSVRKLHVPALAPGEQMPLKFSVR